MPSIVVTRLVCAVIATLGLLGSTMVVAGPADAANLGPSYRVSGVSDGDTIKVVVRGTVERIRLIGIDTPELGRDGVREQCYARAARSAMQKLVKSKRVRLVRDTTQANRDAYGRLLRYVYTGADKRDVAKVLITKGAGRQYTFDRSYRKRATYRSAEKRAKSARRGLWRSCSPGGSSTKPPTGACRIKGNIADDGEKIYHVPGQQYYEVTRIDLSDGERWFCSEADAVAAGWRRSAI